MIETLTGTITGSSPQAVYVRTGPVEWEITAGTRTIRAFMAHSGQEVRLFIHLMVREDDMRMFGFADRRERGVFRALIGVSGIGPKQAIKILSHIDPAELTRMIEAADINALGRLPGIGKKTAQKMVLALQGELVTDASAAESADSFGEIVESLVSMGFDKTAVRSTVESCSQAHGSHDQPPRVREQEIFRMALLELSAREQGS